MTPADVPPFAEPVRAEMRRGEIVRWSGSPEGPPPLGLVAVIMLFGLVWTGLTLQWEGAALGFLWDSWLGDNRSKTPVGVAAIMTAFGLPFVAVGFGMLGAPWLMARERRKTIYVVTSERLLKIVLGRRKKVEVLEARQIFEIVRTDRRSGLGDVEVLRSTRTDSDGDLIEAKVKLESLRDSRGAEAALSALARKTD